MHFMSMCFLCVNVEKCVIFQNHLKEGKEGNKRLEKEKLFIVDYHVIVLFFFLM